MIILNFVGGSPNQSVVAENDLVYYVANVTNQFNNMYMANDSEVASDSSSGGISNHIFIGHVSSVNKTMGSDGLPVFTITTEEPSNTQVTPPQPNDYIFFVKNNLTELAAMKGY